MTIQNLKVRAGMNRPALRGTIVLLLSGGALLAATNIHAKGARGGWLATTERADAAQEAAHITALLDAMRGVNPLACRLATRALQNGWGGRMTPGPETIGAAGDSVFDWAVSSSVESSSLPQLRTALEDADMCVRRTSASLIGRIRSSDGVASELGAQLSNANARTREAAMLAVAYAGKKGDLDAAERGLKDNDASVRLAAVWALGMIGDAGAVPALSDLLKDPDPGMRASAASALGEIESPAAIPSLVALLGSDSQPMVRRAAAQALGQIDK